MQGEAGAVLTGSAPRPSRQSLLAAVGGIAILAYASDQLTKAWALDALADGQPRDVLGEFIQFRLIGNPGAALSLGADRTWVMTLLSSLIVLGILWACRRLGSWPWALAFGLLIGSALGNLTDRFIRGEGGGHGHVVDFIDYNRWFIGNVADIWIVLAAALIMLLALRGIGVDGSLERPAQPADHGSGTTGAEHE